jgi:hypothetical protein
LNTLIYFLLLLLTKMIEKQTFDSYLSLCHEFELNKWNRF